MIFRLLFHSFLYFPDPCPVTFFQRLSVSFGGFHDLQPAQRGERFAARLVVAGAQRRAAGCAQRAVGIEQFDAGAREHRERLPEKRREVLLLRYYLGYNDEEIGKMCSISRSAVFRRRKIALRLLRQEMEVLENEE